MVDNSDPTGASGTINAAATNSGSATISAIGTATETDGTVNQVAGSDQVTVSGTGPSAGITTSLGFSYGTPTATPSAQSLKKK